MATYFVTRHPGAIEWARRQGIEFKLISHLDPDQIEQGDTVLGTLPIQIVARLNKRGALRRSVLGIKTHPRIGDLPDPIDLAIVATPAPMVPDLIGECVEAGVRAVVVISAGFKEIGAEGAALERRIVEQARRGRIRVIGPNSLGVMSPMTGLNATVASAMATKPGKIAFLSQSGALGTAVLDWSLHTCIAITLCATATRTCRTCIIPIGIESGSSPLPKSPQLDLRKRPLAPVPDGAILRSVGLRQSPRRSKMLMQHPSTALNREAPASSERRVL